MSEMAEPWGLRKEWWEMKRELDGFHKMAGLVFFISTSIFWASTIYTVLGTRRLWIADLFLAFRECKFYYTIQGWLHSSKVTKESSGKSKQNGPCDQSCVSEALLILAWRVHQGLETTEVGSPAGRDYWGYIGKRLLRVYWYILGIYKSKGKIWKLF